MNFVSLITAGRGSVKRSERTTLSWSASTISALPSITRRSALRIGTMVNGSKDAFRARQPTTTPNLRRPSCASDEALARNAAASLVGTSGISALDTPFTRDEQPRWKVLPSEAIPVRNKRQEIARPNWPGADVHRVNDRQLRAPRLG